MVNFMVIVLINDSKGVFKINVVIRVMYILMVKFKNIVNNGDNISKGRKLIS